MYLSSDSVLKAIAVLRATVHPFIGITFVACKHFGLKVGSMNEVSLDRLTRAHMDTYHRIDRRSAYYFQPFKGGVREWVNNKYPASGLQTVNTQTFQSVFLHRRNEQLWGFASDYLDRMNAVLANIKAATTVPADAMAVWLLKDADLGEISNYDDLTTRFFNEYQITDAERVGIFSQRRMNDLLSAEEAFVPEPLKMTEVLRGLPAPPDAEAEGGRTISALRLTNAGPAAKMEMEFGQRLTIVTGDNGLGKSFLLDFAWWAATGLWAERMALPQLSGPRATPEVEYTLTGNSGRASSFVAKFDQKTSEWIRPRGAMTVEALAVFSRADGSFAVADPIRSSFNRTAPVGRLTAYQVWNGDPGLIEGLIRDWIRWQSASDRKTFDQFAAVLARLSPEDLGTLSPGEPVRVPGDPRDIPTIRHRYATVPVTHASSGVQRVLLLAYLIIWSWREHELAAERLKRPPLHRMMVIVDELEAHLHPKWQRIVLPALMGIGDLLSSELALQTITATHSPMILASMEATFNSSSDALYHLYGAGPAVRLDETPFVKYGDVSGWLTSPLFGLQHARSRDAELAIEAAKALQMSADPSVDEVREVSQRLRLYLAEDDKFWPRWLYFAEQHGVAL